MRGRPTAAHLANSRFLLSTLNCLHRTTDLSQSLESQLFAPMPYDPNFPPTNAELISAEFREQFQGLKALIDAQAATIASHTAQIASLQAQLDADIASTSSNSNGVPNLGLSIGNNPPQQSEVQPIADKLDELINALRR